MLWRTWLQQEVEVTPATYAKLLFLDMDLWKSMLTPEDGWYFRKSPQMPIYDAKQGNKGWADPNDAVMAGVKYYTAGNK